MKVHQATGGDDADLLYGGSGNDELYGDADDDALYGGIGDDELEGGAGTDTLEGGTGSDTITDFSMDESDAVDLSAFSGITGFGDLSLTDDGSDTVVDLGSHGDGTVRLEGVSSADLEAGDFGL